MSIAIDLITTSKNITATTVFPTTRGGIKGIFVSSASGSPTIKVWDNNAASGAVLVNTFTPVAATWYEFGLAGYGTGLTVQIGGTVSCTVTYTPVG